MSAPTPIPRSTPAKRGPTAQEPRAVRCGGAWSVIAIDDAAALEQHVAAWDDLAAAAVEPNVFYESWMLLPALRAYSAGARPLIVLVFVQAPAGQLLLCGLFPLVRRRLWRLPADILGLWQYVHGFLNVPLVRASHGPECLAALFDWLATDRRGAPLLECTQITGDGGFNHLLLDHLEAHGRGAHVTAAHTRALLRQGDGDGYLQTVLSGEKRKKLRRAESRLAERGPVQYLALAPDGDVDAWIADFFRLEASGWKGRDGTAMVSSEADRRFFESVVRSAFARRQLMMLALHAGGQPVALLCNFLTRDGAFAFKVAFDEEAARFSPGVLLELENVRRMHADRRIAWMDSCTAAGDTLVKHLWTDRRVIQTTLIETGRRRGKFLLAALPLARWLRRLVRKN